jgi:hypothetical protein
MRAATNHLRIAPDEVEAQRLVCRELIRACEDALGRLATRWLEVGGLTEEAARARAKEILSDTLSDWKRALVTLDAVALEPVPA